MYVLCLLLEGTCVDKVNGFNCTCQAGFTGIRCDANINECLRVSCGNGEITLDIRVDVLTQTNFKELSQPVYLANRAPAGGQVIFGARKIELSFFVNITISATRRFGASSIIIKNKV